MKNNYALFRNLKPKMRAILGGCLLFTASHAFAQNDPWNIYGGDVMPNALVSNPFVTSNVIFPNGDTDPDAAIVESENAIVPDPADPNNSLLRFRVDGNPHRSFMWRQNFPSTPAAPTAATIVVRAQGIEGLERAFELDLDFGGFRETVYILNDGRVTFNEARKTDATKQNISLGNNFNALEWHTYRFTKDGGTVNLYVDESATPVATVTVPASTVRNYFRIGDGASSNTYGSYIDYILWDVTGAYAPAQKAIPTGTITKLASSAASGAKVSVYPNPATGSHANLSFFLSTASDVSIQLFDVTGKKIGQSVSYANVGAGQNEVSLPVAGLKQGTYLYQISTNRYTVTQKMLVK